MRQTRILYSDNGTITDLTSDINNYHAGSFSLNGFSETQDFIYVGNIAPFNHFYLKLGTANSTSLTLDVDYWNGNSWVSMVEIIDDTKGLTESGFLTFVPDKNKSWINADTNGTGQQITGLTSVTIYDRYWVRISLSAAPSAGTELSWVGQLFSSDSDLGSEYPELLSSAVLTSFEAGKTSWEEQSVRAAELVVQDLIRAGIIFSKGQILERHSFMLPSVSKVAELAYSNFGDDYADQKTNARNEYKARMDKTIFDVDLNLDGELQVGEMATKQGFMSR